MLKLIGSKRMGLRRLHRDDIPKIAEIWERCHKGKYGIPPRNFLITEAVTESNGKITGYGMVRFFAEAMLYLDKDLPIYDRAKSFKLLMDQAIEDSHGLEQINVDVDDPEFEKILKDRFGFVRRDNVLYLDLEKLYGK